MRLLSELFEIPISLGSVGRLRPQMSEAIEQSVEGVHRYAQQQPVIGMDETSLPQGNVDGMARVSKAGCG